MRSRRVLVLKLGVWGLGVDAKSVRSVRKHSQASTSIRRVFASVRGRKSSRNAELSSLLDLLCVFASQKCQHSQDRAGQGREMQSCRHFWTCFWSSRLKSVNIHRIGRVKVAKCRAVVTFGIAFGLRVSKVSTVTRIGGS